MSVFKDQEVFMKACGQTTDVYNAEQATMYCDLIAEEYSEFEDSGSAITDLDAIIDCIVVLIGYGLSCGYDVAGAWDEVIRSNMAKIDPETGTVIRREDGKILKPEGWTPPDLSRFVP